MKENFQICKYINYRIINLIFINLYYLNRSIKLKSFLLDSNGNCKMSNFGKICHEERNCMVNDNSYNKDFIDFGGIVCQMITGIMNQIDIKNYESLNLNDLAKELIKDILNKQHENIKTKTFFNDIDWIKLDNGEINPPFKPVVVNKKKFNLFKI